MLDILLAVTSSFFIITFLETILAIDNLLFIYIVTSKLPKSQQKKAQNIAISLAAIMRIACLFAIVWIMQLTKPLFYIFTMAISTKDLILIGGGLFLIAKASHEIYHLFNPKQEQQASAAKSMFSAIVQIIIIDSIFSIDSVITAVGLSDNVWIITAAIITSCALMLIAARFIQPLAKSVNVKFLALGCLVFIGIMITGSGVDIYIDKSYLFTAMGFAIAIQIMQYFYKKTKKHNATI